MSEPRVRARIQFHPSRTDLLPNLEAALAPLPTEVISDESDPPNPWSGYKRCLTDLPDCTHLLVIQDDAQPCVNFAPALEQIAAANPDTPIVLFLGGLPRRTGADAMLALKNGWNYSAVWVRDFLPVVAVLWPKHKAEEFMHWASTNKLPGQFPRSDDAVGGRWMMRTNQRILVTVPSLVQHPDMVPSIIGRRAAWGKDGGRVARLFIEGDPLDIDWSRVPSAQQLRRHRSR